MKIEVIGDKRSCTLVIPKDLVITDDVDLSGMGLTKLPDLSAVTVDGDFECYGNNLTSLAGAPKSVGGVFDCSDNQLTTLQGAPQTVDGVFYCYDNLLTTLEGAPQSVGGDFDCSNNQLKSLAGAPKNVSGDFLCDNKRLVKEYEEKKLACFAAKQKQKKR